jgi:hypothetical protein
MGANFFSFFIIAELSCLNTDLNESIQELDAAIRPEVAEVTGAFELRNLAKDVGTFRSDTKEGTGTLPTNSDESKTWADSSLIRELADGRVTDG